MYVFIIQKVTIIASTIIDKVIRESRRLLLDLFSSVRLLFCFVVSSACLLLFPMFEFGFEQ